jgi:TolB-like protein
MKELPSLPRSRSTQRVLFVNHRLACLVFASLLALSFAVSALAASPEQSTEKGEPRIAVLEFDAVTEQARKSGRGRMIGEFFATAAAKTKGVRVVERERIKAVLDELEFGGAGSTYASMAEKVGDMSGADFMLVGSISELGQSVRIDARLVETKNGKVRAAESMESKASMSALSQSVDKLMRKLAAALRPSADATFSARVWTDKPKYASGESVRIFVEGNRNFYARVVMIASDGSIIQLLPNEYRAANFFQANKTYALPAEGDQYTLDVVPPLGRDRIVLFASQSPLGEAPLVPLERGLGQFKGSEEKYAKLTRAIKVSSDKSNAAKVVVKPLPDAKVVVSPVPDNTDVLKVETVIETR